MSVKTTCPCGQTIEVHRYHHDPAYDITVHCETCHRTATSGSSLTGEITGWMTEREIEDANEQYEIDAFSEDMNEFYGRGTW